MKQFLFNLLIILPGLCFGQDYLIDNLKGSRWTSKIEVTDFNMNGFKKIGLSKLIVPVDSIKSDVSIWEFSEKELKILSYKFGQGLGSSIIKCSYDYDKNKSVMRIFHFSQDSNCWEYSLGIISTGNYILMTRKN